MRLSFLFGPQLEVIHIGASEAGSQHGPRCGFPYCGWLCLFCNLAWTDIPTPKSKQPSNLESCVLVFCLSCL